LRTPQLALALLWVSINLIEGVTARHVPGYPNSTQIFFTIGVPAAATLILSAVIFHFVVRCPLCLGILSVVALLILPFYLAIYGGGVCDTSVIARTATRDKAI
jgi:hypothetical protein